MERNTNEEDESIIAEALENSGNLREKIQEILADGGENVDGQLAEIAKQFGLTRERIRQIEARALSKLRRPTRSRRARRFLND